MKHYIMIPKLTNIDQVEAISHLKPMPVDTDEELRAAELALHLVGLPKAPVFIGKGALTIKTSIEVIAAKADAKVKTIRANLQVDS